MSNSSHTILYAKNLVKTFEQGNKVIHAVNNTNLIVNRGDFISITGASGSGKTTLLNIIGCILRPDCGTLFIGNSDVVHATESDRAKIRRDKIGYIFQDYKLLPSLTARENITLPMRLSGRKVNEEYLLSAVGKLGIDCCLDAFPSQLSGGQQQRVSIARALLHHPDIILADEPTGNLDSENTNEIVRTLAALSAQGTTILMVTHNDKICDLCNRQFIVSDGCLSEFVQDNRVD